MGYHSTASLVDDGYDDYGGYGYTAQFKPSSTALPALGNISNGNVFGGAPAVMDGGSFGKTPFNPFNTRPAPPLPTWAQPKATPPVVAPIATLPAGLKPISTPPSTSVPNQPILIAPPIIDYTPINTGAWIAAPTAPAPTQQQAQNAQDNATALAQQAATAKAAGNDSLSSSLMSQSISWNDINKAITSAIPTGTGSNSNLIPTDSSGTAAPTSPTTIAGITVTPAIMLGAAALVALLLFKK